MQEFAITSPAMGIKEDIPSILLSQAYLSDSVDMIFRDGELKRAKKRKLEFADQLPDPILHQPYYEKPASSTAYAMVFTRRDICWRDKSQDRYVFINKIYNTGIIIDAVENSNDTFTLTLQSADLSDVQPGDFIQLDDDVSYHTGVIWYEISDAISDDTLICIGSLPSNFDIPSSGREYAIRLQFNTEVSGGMWSTAQMLEKLVMSNNVDNVLVWDGSGQAEDLVNCPYRCKVVYNYENRLILFDITLIQTGENMPFAFAFSGIDDIEDWGDTIKTDPNYTGVWDTDKEYLTNDIVKYNGLYYVALQNTVSNATSPETDIESWGALQEPSDSSYWQVNEGRGKIIGAGDYAGFLYIFKEKSIVKAWTVVDIDVFHKTISVENIGTFAPESIVSTEKGIFFYANDGTFRLWDGITPIVISDNIRNKARTINPEFNYLVRGKWIREFNYIVWAAPYSSSETNDIVFVYNIGNGINGSWTTMDMPVSTWGEYLVETGIMNWYDLTFADWYDWDWENWFTYTVLAGNPLILMGGYDGYVYRAYGSEQDNGIDYNGYAVIETDLSPDKSLANVFKRMTNIWVFTRPDGKGKYMDLSAKRDTNPLPKKLGRVELAGPEAIIRKKLACDIRAKSFSVKISLNNPGTLIGLIFQFKIDGEN